MKLIVREPIFVPGKPPPPGLRGPGLHTPKRAGDVGYDLESAQDSTQCEAGSITTFRTDVFVHAEKGLWYTIAARSSLHEIGGLVPFNVIDSEYQGELLVKVVALRQFTIERGQRIAQLIFFRSVLPDIQVVHEFPGSERGEAGFGSTGR